jgi:enoyl-CoA hydratase/carnithine racemase
LSTEHVTYGTDGAIAIVTFNRPEVHNAMTWEMYEALAGFCDVVDQDPRIHVAILRGAGGKAFIAGTDIAQFQRFGHPEDGLRYEERLDRALDRLERVTKPTIAQIEGVAAGGGCAIAFASDLRFATPEATFGVPIARTLGNCLSGASYARLVDLLGPALLKEMMFTGRLMSASEAQAHGLVNRIVAPADITAAVFDCARQIAANAPLTLRATKEMLRRIAAKRRLPSGEDRDLVALCYGSDDFREGVTAFLEKRRPEWKGQ